MNGSEDIKQYDDPLMGRVQGNNRSRRSSQAGDGQHRRGYWGVLGGIGVLVALVLLGYWIYQSQQRIESLSAKLESSQEQISTVTGQLEDSQSTINQLQEGLSESKSQLGKQRQELGRYQNLYSDLRQGQSEQGKELEAISIRKADQAEVNALRTKAEGLEEEVSSVNTKVQQAQGDVAKLQDATATNAAGIAGNRDSLGSLKVTVDSNTEEIGGVKRSLDRDYYNFELQKNGGVMKVFDVSLQLKNTDFKAQRYHVEIIADGRRINKKKVSINEPIYFYVEGKKKPYEVLVNRIDKKFVVGYLSVPKG